MELPTELSFDKITELALITSELGFRSSGNAGSYGALGAVYITERKRAVKQIKPQENIDITNEIKILHYIATKQKKNELGADHCLHFLGWWSGNHDWWKGMKEATYILTDRYEKTLQDTNPKNSIEIKRIMMQLCQGLQFLHSNNIVHLDIKPANIMFDSKNTLKIIDFGCAKLISEKGISLTGKGTPPYMAPEMFIGDVQVKYSADIYAVGCICYEMITQETFIRSVINITNTEEKKKLEYKIPVLFDLFSSSRELIQSYIDRLELNDENLSYILKGCLNMKPEDRLSAKDVVKALQNSVSLNQDIVSPKDIIVSLNPQFGYRLRF